MGVRGDLCLLETAVRRRYEIDTKLASETVNKYMGDPDPRVALRALAIAAVMEGQNQKDELADIDELRRKLIQLANEFGVGLAAAEGDRITADDDHQGIAQGNGKGN